jgi:hypothetical protein
MTLNIETREACERASKNASLARPGATDYDPAHAPIPESHEHGNPPEVDCLGARASKAVS